MHMTHRILAIASLATALIVPTVLHADDVTGIRKEMITSLDDAGGKLIELAEAVPQAKYNWKPGKDVRSASEVFLHVVTANYGLPMFIGVQPPADSPVTAANFSTFEKTTTDKAKVIHLLKDSFVNAKRTITETPDSDLETQVDLFGNKMSKRAALLVLVNHAHEHLGQSIAYARTNGIVPPWTAREHAAAKKAAMEKASSGK